VSLKDAGLKAIGREPQGMPNPLRSAQGSCWRSQRRGAFRYGFQVPHSRFEGSMGKRGQSRMGHVSRLESAKEK
jgi:hypothetical protein